MLEDEYEVLALVGAELTLPYFEETLPDALIFNPRLVRANFTELCEIVRRLGPLDSVDSNRYGRLKGSLAIMMRSIDGFLRELTETQRTKALIDSSFEKLLQEMSKL